MTTATANNADTIKDKGLLARAHDKIRGEPPKEKDAWSRTILPSGDLVTPACTKFLTENPQSKFIGYEISRTVKVAAGYGLQREELADSPTYRDGNIVPGTRLPHVLEYLRRPATPATVPPPEDREGQIRASATSRDAFWRIKDGGTPTCIGFALGVGALKRCVRTGSLSAAGRELFLSGMGDRIKQIMAEGDNETEGQPS